ncbi:homeobox-domain-containing protein [Laetiporus sulphureus 93-53]|uniref:Homeobox-domain-containing protein n=1 Tax=Laetiporus sulphureus 93-53 TaxID=1314785 RepID=A0A165CJ01_9APHY|nr:homeobox-domain-containing protein [Laetiporus sulphureus 93-53]KZT02897.1 homeobox-domain-containing protein [Laetiporus sulphureus 93-53]
MRSAQAPRGVTFPEIAIQMSQNTLATLPEALSPSHGDSLLDETSPSTSTSSTSLRTSPISGTEIPHSPRLLRTRAIDAGIGVVKQKRKRSRVTPEQLAQLERFFEVNRNPTAAQRKEICDQLGMAERQTQIWFQNRRAKAKLQAGARGVGEELDNPPQIFSYVNAGDESELRRHIGEDGPVTFMPCYELTIGTWRRIAMTHDRHDLIAYVPEARRCIVWHVQCAGSDFKMEIPFDVIVDTSFAHVAPGLGRATFSLSKPPVFFHRKKNTSQSNSQVTCCWKQCSDWTQDKQATRVLRHELVGSAVVLSQVAQNYNLFGAYGDISLLAAPRYAEEPQDGNAGSFPTSVSRQHSIEHLGVSPSASVESLREPSPLVQSYAIPSPTNVPQSPLYHYEKPSMSAWLDGRMHTYITHELPPSHPVDVPTCASTSYPITPQYPSQYSERRSHEPVSHPGYASHRLSSLGSVHQNFDGHSSQSGATINWNSFPLESPQRRGGFQYSRPP